MTHLQEEEKKTFCVGVKCLVLHLKKDRPHIPFNKVHYGID